MRYKKSNQNHNEHLNVGCSTDHTHKRTKSGFLLSFHLSSFFFLQLARMDQHSDIRRSAYKERSRFKPEEVRRRRENAQVEIRKQKKEENLAKRRNFNAQELGEDSDDELDSAHQDAQVRQLRSDCQKKERNSWYCHSVAHV